MSLKSSNVFGKSLAYSNFHERLIINRKRKILTVINPRTKKIEASWKSRGKGIKEFKVFGEKDNRIISVTEDGDLILYSLDHGQKRGPVFELKLSKGEIGTPISVAVCNKNEYVFVALAVTWKKPKMMVMKLVEDTLIQTAVIDQLIRDTGFTFTYGCFGYVERHILWVGLSGKENGRVQVYDYDTETRELNRIESMKANHQESRPKKLHSFGKSFYYTGKNGKLMCMTLIN